MPYDKVIQPSRQHHSALCWRRPCSHSHALLCSCSVQVILVPSSLDGRDSGPPTQLPAFSTGDSLLPPQPVAGLSINPVVGPDRFTVLNISQDKPGFAYLLVTKPFDQVNALVSDA